METLPRQLPLRRHEPTADDVPPARTASGIWSLDGERLGSVQDFDVGPAVVLVPTEHVLLLVVDLPLPTRSRRIAALPFAVEDRLAEPVEAVHVALGVKVAAGRFLVGVVRHDVMRRWTRRLIEAGLDHALLVPDAVGLPIPAAGGWSLDIAAGRAMVRRPDATGFALPVRHLEAAWRAEDSPSCIAYGEAPPPALDVVAANIEDEPLATRLALPSLDLRQGPYARPRRALHPLWRRIAIVAAIGVGAHGAIVAADTIALSRIADSREAEARALAASEVPNLQIRGELRTAVADLVPAGMSAPGIFLPLTVRTARALQPLGSPINFQALAFDAAARTLVIEVEASDIGILQRVAGALTAAGLTAEAGAASVDQGRAVGSFTVRMP